MKIVQIGTCVANDDLTQIIKNSEPEILILVEPMSIHNEKIKECYEDIKNKIIENIAITTDSRDEMSFFYHKNDGPMFEVASSSLNHIIKHGYSMDGVIELKVKCYNLNDFFDKHNISHLDILFIDAEGMDDDIIKSIDYSRFKIDKIYFENLHLKDPNIYNFLNNLGYKITQNIGLMGWSSLAEK